MTYQLSEDSFRKALQRLDEDAKRVCINCKIHYPDYLVWDEVGFWRVCKKCSK